MYDIIIDDIIGYITDELNHEDHDFKNLIHFLNDSLKKLRMKRWSKENKNAKELLIIDLEKYKKQIEQIKEIRDTYQKGKSFANNQTKGKQKLYTPINMYLHIIKMYLDRERFEKAKEKAIFSLNNCKGLYSDRTYYRLKQRIKELGIVI